MNEKLSNYINSEFDYIETKNIQEVSNIDCGNSGIYMEATVVYFEITNLAYVLKESGRRKTATLYTMFKEVLTAIADETGAFVNCFAPNAFLVVYPGRDESQAEAVKGALKIVYAITEEYKNQFTKANGLEFAMGLDHGHIMGTKNPSDDGKMEHLSWFGTCIHKAMRIANECARPFYVGISGIIYHSLGEDLRIASRRILGLKKNVEMWTKLTYKYENVKKHLYQTNHKFSPEHE